ncbi:MAG: transcriptional repressor [Gammaproteobacteria bacterium]|nr:transcriptional repressor [Gammaproteobacteria bacterium]
MEAYDPANPESNALAARLCDYDINPTPQRIEITRILFEKPAHFAADEIYAKVNVDQPRVSRATVYNTLGLFVERGLLRQVIIDPNKVFYDSNTDRHYHFYDTQTGELKDIDASNIEITGLPELPDGTELDGVEVIVRLRGSR